MTPGRLFDHDDAVRQQQKAKAENPLAEVFAVYRSEYEKRFHEKPVVTKADAGQVARLVKDQGRAKVIERIPIYLSLEDPYLRQRGYPLALLAGSWNRITATQLQQKMSDDGAVDRTRAYLRKLRGQS